MSSCINEKRNSLLNQYIILMAVNGKELFVIINKDRILVFPLVMITLSTKL